MGIALIPIVLWYLPVAALLLGLAVFVAPLKKRLERLGKLSRQLGKAG
jgi:cytochrome c-type biogenesis protein CcmH/NrfF